MKAPGYENGFALTLLPHRLHDTLKRKRPTMYFVNSMSDLFHESVPFDYIDQVFETIERTPSHTYQILTKRVDRLEAYFMDKSAPRNAWIGVSVEDRKYGVPRIHHLRRVDAAVRFLLIEPLLSDVGTLDLRGIYIGSS